MSHSDDDWGDSDDDEGQRPGQMLSDANHESTEKLRDENGSKPRLKALLTAQWLRSSPAPVPTAADEILEAIVAVDKEMAAALRTEGDQAAVTAAVGQLKGATEDADVLLALATQAAAAGLLDLASHIAHRCGTAKALAAPDAGDEAPNALDLARVAVGDRDLRPVYVACVFKVPSNPLTRGRHSLVGVHTGTASTSRRAASWSSRAPPPPHQRYAPPLESRRTATPATRGRPTSRAWPGG